MFLKMQSSETRICCVVRASPEQLRHRIGLIAGRLLRKLLLHVLFMYF